MGFVLYLCKLKVSFLYHYIMRCINHIGVLSGAFRPFWLLCYCM